MISFFSYKQCVKKLLRLVIPNLPTKCHKSLSVNETSIALRPFIFRVHPDLFAKYGIEKARINEESLKLLNEYIQKLHNNEHVTPLKLMFYLRRISTNIDSHANTPELKTVNISLQSTNVTDTISSILNACHLPMDYLESIGVSRHSFNVNKSGGHFNSGGSGSSTTLEWTSDADLWRVLQQMEFKVFNSRMEQDTSSNVHTRHHNEHSVNTWLKKNLKKARDNIKKVQPIRDEIAKLQSLMVQELGLVDIKWQSGWTINTHCSALKGLHRVLSSDRAGLNLRGKTVVFSNDLGISVEGHILLRQDTVAESWKHIIKNQSKFDPTLISIPHHQHLLSDLLNGIQVLPPQHTFVLAVDYLKQLKLLIDCISIYRRDSGDDIGHGVKDLQLTVECTTGPLLMTEKGQIMVPTSCPAFLIFEYIKKNAAKARSTQKDFIRSQISDETTISLCQTMLGLEALVHDSSITRQQMVTCCRRLIRLADNKSINLDLSSIRLRIGQFYTVTVEGEMCVPWNFEDVL